jgi:hypothetical protein
MSLIHNERTKLLANAFNTAATSCFTVGVLAPLAAVFYKIGPGPVPFRSVAFGTLIWLSVASFLHYRARGILGGLIP